MSQGTFWIKGTLLLTIAGFLSKILGMIYRVPLQNMTGDEGLYIYQQIYPILSIALMLSIYSFPSAISELVASSQRSSRKPRIEHGAALFFLLLFFGLFMFTMIFLFSGKLAILMGDPSLEVSIRVAAGMFLLIPFSALLRGFFQGLEQTKYVAVSQIIEQFVRVIFIIIFTFIVTKQQYSIYGLGSMTAVGTMSGTLVSILFLLVAFYFFKNKNGVIFGQLTYINKRIFRALIVGSIIYGLTYLLHLLLQFIDVFTMVKALKEYGFSFEAAKEQKGIYDRGNAIIQLGLVFGSSLAMALIPSMQKQNDLGIGHERLAFKITFALSLAASIGLVAIMPLFNPLLYKTSKGTLALQLMMLLVFLLSMVILFSVILQRYNYRLKQLIWITLMIVIKVVLNIVLIPMYGIVGASVASVVACSVLLIILLIKWLRRTKATLDWVYMFKVSLSTLCMGSVIGFSSYFLSSIQFVENRFVSLAIVLLLCLLGVLIFLTLIYLLKVFSKDEREQLFSR
ncbi:oligosaccharide flippase family protein [Bacillaceae bacterium W0354]